ncbi:putative ABC transporter ATP-binding protein YfiL [Collibacillus ludicampi]|uniref:ABC transporter ATP-binding protein YfiL n=1 Tax=Collibacillus ludicampi TaxID=2771369 RepID=A0AAV4LF99_9BACL|nr:ABC transporter ATP-binding protein [Collibacillus ludicampi]GIM46194.1 putative ABC transporter ATP-binding protein YfiL [Collibacillus ludicampi]
MTAVLEVENLSKAYGSKQALRNVSFSVEAGTCFGLLGPNGAGKSTTMKIITGIIDRDDGTVTVLGHDSKREREEIRKKVGYVPQEITLYEKLSAFDNLVFFGELYGVRGPVLKKRIDEVLELVGLADRAKDAVGTFSGGLKRRINIAAALLHKPKLIILDEPTVGIDPQSRNHIFNMIRELKEEGVTVVYSTHYMEEAEALCDHIAIIDHGQVIAQGSLEELLDNYGRKSVYVEAEGWSELPQLPHVKQIKEEKRGWMIETDHLLETMNSITRAALEQDIIVHQLEIKRPSLETVFLSLTGTSLRD